MFKYTLIAAILIVFLISVGVYFVTTDHPWFALLMFLLAGSVSIRTTDCDDGDDEATHGGEA